MTFKFAEFFLSMLKKKEAGGVRQCRLMAGITLRCVAVTLELSVMKWLSFRELSFRLVPLWPRQISLRKWGNARGSTALGLQEWDAVN